MFGDNAAPLKGKADRRKFGECVEGGRLCVIALKFHKKFVKPRQVV